MNAVIIKSVKEAEKINDLVDAYILPIQNFSINYQVTFTLEEVKKIKKFNKEVFVIINKNIHNEELSKLEKLLIEVEKLNINGIFFYDIAIISLKEKLKLKTDLVWSQEHLTTNYQTINYWYQKGVKYTYLSSELNKEEINEISKNTKAILFVNVFGYQPMFTSRRHLVKNYLNKFKLIDENKNKKIFKEEKSYPIIDEPNGTTVYSNYILNATNEHFDAKYLVFNTYLIDNFEDVLKNNLYPIEKGFLDKKIIYKVKDR